MDNLLNVTSDEVNEENTVKALKDKGTVYDNSPEWIEQAVTESLKRLQTDYIDLYQVHYFDKKTPVEQIVEKLEQLKQRGLIRFYGLSNIHNDDMKNIAPFKNNFVSFQDEYSLACRKNEDDILLLKEKMDMSVLTWGSLGQGILTGKYDVNVTFNDNDRRSRDAYVNFHGEKLKKNLSIVSKMRELSEQTGKSVSAIAIRWILDYLEDSVVLTGIKKRSQIIGNCDAADWKLSDEFMSILNEVSK